MYIYVCTHLLLRVAVSMLFLRYSLLIVYYVCMYTYIYIYIYIYIYTHTYIHIHV